MPRNSSGFYTLPLPPVVPGTIIESVWANSTLDDLSQAVSDSLDRYGRGGMVGAFHIVDGTVLAPGLSFTNETGSGFYRETTGVVGLSILGVKQQSWSTNGASIGTLTVTGGATVTGGLTVDGVPVNGSYVLKAGDSMTGVLNVNNGSTALQSANIGLQRTGTELDTVGHAAGIGFVNSTTGTSTLVQQYAGNMQFFSLVPPAGWVERMRIAANGNVGIGDTTPSTKLDVRGGIQASAPVGTDLTIAALVDGINYTAIGYNDSAVSNAFGAPTKTAYVAANGSTTHLIFGTAAGERMRITPQGWVTIASAASDGVGSTRFQVGSGASTAQLLVKSATSHLALYADSGGSSYFSVNDGSALHIGQAPANGLTFADRMTILANGNVGIGTNSPGTTLHVFRSGVGASVLVQNNIASDASIRTKTTLGDYIFGTGIGLAGNVWNVYDIAAGATRFLINDVGNVGVGTTTPTALAHGGNNRVINIHNANTVANSQSHLILTSASNGLANSSIGSVSWGGTGNVIFGYLGAATAADSTDALPSLDMVLATKAAGGPGAVERLRITSAGQILGNVNGSTTKIELGYRDLIGEGVGDVPITMATRGMMKYYATNFSVPILTPGCIVTTLNYGGGPITISPGAGVTLHLAGTPTVGARTLASQGICTLYWRDADNVYASGPGVS